MNKNMTTETKDLIVCLKLKKKVHAKIGPINVHLNVTQLK